MKKLRHCHPTYNKPIHLYVNKLLQSSSLTSFNSIFGSITSTS